jgi:hypothetical protein
MDVFISPFEIMDNTLIRKLFLENEDILKEVQYPLFDIEMIKLCNHSFLVFKVSFILIDKCISLINYTSDVVKNGCVSTPS